MSELEQTKKVLDVIANLINEKETCTYRHLIYDLLEFKENAYSELISGLTITNFLVYVKEQDKEIKRLKEEYMILQNASDEVEEELQDRIDKAIEFIEIYNEEDNPDYGSTFINKNDYTYVSFDEYRESLLNILRGEDNE